MPNSSSRESTRWSDFDIYDNTPREVIVVHRDTLDNKLRDLELGIESKRELRHSVELILALLGILLTSNFKDFLSIPSSYWFAIFFLALIWAVVRLCWDLIFRFGIQKYPTRLAVLEDLMAKTKRLEGGESMVAQDDSDGKFLIQEEGRSKVYEVENGIKKHIPDTETLSKLGYKWEEIHKVTATEASKYRTGDPLPSQK